ncbi:MAG: flagellar motor switch protein FliG [Geminicoccaceae bacterium]
MTVPFEGQPLRSDEKAAIVLFNLGPDRAEKLFKRMEEAEHRRFAHAFNRLKEVSAEQVAVVLSEFTSSIAEAQALRGGASEARDFLLKVLEPQSVDQIMADVEGVVGRDLWERLSNTPEQELASHLEPEKPQTVAVILSRLRPDKAARILLRMPDARAHEIILRLAHLRRVDQDVVEELTVSVMQDLFTRVEHDSPGARAPEMIGSMLSEMPAEQATSLLAFLQENSPEVAEAAKKFMFRFEDIPTKVTPPALQIIIRNCEKDTLVLALRLAQQHSPKIVEYFMANMSKRAAEQLREDIEALGAVRLKDAQGAQAEVIRVIQELARSGEIVLAGQDDQEPMVG